jgi:hypothetical protein
VTEMPILSSENIKRRKEINQRLEKVETSPGYSFFHTNLNENEFFVF